MESLFDGSQRTRTAPANHQMSGYEFLNTSAWSSANYIRAVLNNWYDSFPRDPEFLGNFTSKNDIQHWSAFFELFAFQLFRKCHYEVTYNHPIGTRKVDLRASRNQEILLDCTLSGEPNVSHSIRTIEKCILDVVESTPSPIYWIFVDFETATTTTPSLRKIRNLLLQTLETLLKSSKHDSVIYFQDSEWSIRFRFMKKNPPVARSLGANSSSQGGGFIEGVSAEVLRSTLNAKRGSSYRIDDKAFVIAINCLNPFIDSGIVKQSLFGSPDAPESQFIKDPFFWHNNNPQNTSVSAVLIAKGLHWSSVGTVDLEVWHNPWAKFPLSPAFLPVNQVLPILGPDNRLTTMEKIPGTTTGHILDIQEDFLVRD